MLSHGNIVADYSAAIQCGLKLSNTDIHLSYLPLAHMFERIVQAVLWVEGASVGFYQGSTLKVMEDLQALRPTLFPSVPRSVSGYRVLACVPSVCARVACVPEHTCLCEQMCMRGPFLGWWRRGGGGGSTGL